ncbi:MAG: MFS transporter [SAR324 cluster bacterium]|nr:MFS transporter [SAR324 cluster bacterium]
MKAPAAGQSPAILPVLILAQLLGVSLWFVSNAVLPSLIADWALDPSDGGLLVSAVQVGFITGTLLFALTNLADIFRPSRVFLCSALLGAGVNLLFAYSATGLGEALAYRFITGLAMAGVYPVGMKIIVSYFPHSLGNALGWLLGAFAMGSALPFLMVHLGADYHWQTVIAAASLLSACSGLLVIMIGDGPHLQPALRLELRMMFQVFRIPAYRASALGYFGHSWEIFALWVLSPLLVGQALSRSGWEAGRWASLGAFAVIGIAAAGSIAGGLLSRRIGSYKVAVVSLAVSGAFCLVLPLMALLPFAVYLPLLVLWSSFALADSAQYSAISSRACPPAYVGTGLTIQNSIGFAITVMSIEVTYRAWEYIGPYVGWLMAPGPLLGLYFLWRESQGGKLIEQ